MTALMPDVEAYADEVLTRIAQSHPDIDSYRDGRGLVHLMGVTPGGRAVGGHVQLNPEMSWNDVEREICDMVTAMR